jgi:glutamate racemase
MPHENLIYVADSLHTPYGERSSEFIANRVERIAEFLLSKNVKSIVVACNTATAAAIHTLREKYDIPIIGLEPALKPAVEFSESEKVGVLATQATLDSEKYQTLRSRFMADAQLIEKASNFFVELVERAESLSSQEFKLIEKELAPFKSAKIDSLVLGCTHYPFLTDAIQAIMGENVKLFESGAPVAKEVKRRIENKLTGSSSLGKISYYSSSPENTQKTFNRILNANIELLSFE